MSQLFIAYCKLLHYTHTSHADKKALREEICKMVAQLRQLNEKHEKELGEVRKEHSKCKRIYKVPLHKKSGDEACKYDLGGHFRGQNVTVTIEKPTTEQLFHTTKVSQVHHPNLVQLMAPVWDDQGGPMIFTELLDTTLKKAYEDNPLTMGQCMDIFCGVACALSYLHEYNITHNRVSSANIYVTGVASDRWIAKLSDFASTMREYTAPEALPPHHALAQTNKTDVYSYGILLCEVTLRKLPNPDYLHKMKEKMRTNHVHLHSLVERCTLHTPDMRPSMAAVLGELERMRLKL